MAKNNWLKSKKGVAPIIIALTFIAAVVTILSATGYIRNPIASITGDVSAKYIEAPYYATIKCEQSSTANDYSADISADGEWISDNLPLNTDEWNIRLQSDPKSRLRFRRRFEYWICPQRSKEDNCIHKSTASSDTGDFDYSLGSISSDRHIYVEFQSFGFDFDYDPVDGGSFFVTYKPYTLFRTDRTRGGEQQVQGAIGCTLPPYDDAWEDRVVYSEDPDVKPSKDISLELGDRFNYISGTITRASMGNVQDGGYCIYSNGRANIYDIKKIKTQSHTYYVVDIDDKIGTDECCDGQNEPDRTCIDGNWQSTRDAECSLFNPCEGSEWRTDYSTSLPQAIKYSCVDGICQVETKEVECSRDTDCKTNEVCNPNTFECEQASVEGGGGEERIPTTQEECLEKGYEWIPKQTKKSGGLNVGGFGIGGETVIVEAHCERPSFTSWGWIIALIFIAVVLLIFRNQLFAGFKLILNKIGI